MKRTFALLYLAMTSLVFPLGTVSAKEISDAATIDSLAAKYWERELRENLSLAAQVGRPIETIPPVSLADAEEMAAFAKSVLNELSGIDPKGLDHQWLLTLRKLEFLAAKSQGDAQYYWLVPRAAPYSCALPVLETMLARMPLKNEDDIKRYLKLLRDYAAYVGSLQDFLEGQRSRKIVMPKLEVAAVSSLLHSFVKPSGVSRLRLEEGRLGSFPKDGQEAAARQAAEIIDGEIVPAMDKLVAYFDGQYSTEASSQIGLSQYPDGRDYYRFLVKQRTTLDVSPAELHELGLKEIARIDHELESIRQEVRFEGDLAAFKKYLKDDRRFFAPTSEVFESRLKEFVGKAEAASPKFFNRRPKAPYAIEPLPAALAGAQTFGYYDQPTAARPKGTYYYNASHPETTSMLSAAAMILHELIPGHYLQIGLQQENEGLPDLRRYDHSELGYLEGWGEYASQLGFEMGLYADPYDRAGRLMLDAMMSARLVVDTGMNDLGWSLEKAGDYLRANTTLADRQINSELLRYSTDLPAQALAYKTGEKAMLDLREMAKERLGDKFDLREFHSWILDSGSMTLDTLREHVAYEISQRQP